MKALWDRGWRDFRITALCVRVLEDACTFRRRGEGPQPRPSVSANRDDPLAAPHLYVSDIHAETLPEVLDDWRWMLDSDIVDAVLVLTPVALHPQIALDCLRAGKHVLVEKPFAITVRAGQVVVKEALRRALVVDVAENLHYHERVRIPAWLIAQGLIGEPQMWLSGGIGNEWSPNRMSARTAWRHRKLEAGGGGSVDVGVHLFHQVRSLVGPVEEVSAYVKAFEPERVDLDELGEVSSRVKNELEDAYFANFRLANWGIGTALWSWAGHGDPTSFSANPVVYGSRGSIRGEEIILDDGLRAPARILFERRAPGEVKRAFFPLGVRDAFGLEMLDLLQAIRGRRQMEASGDEGVLDLATAYAILESATANRPVKVADVLGGKVVEYQAEINAYYQL